MNWFVQMCFFKFEQKYPVFFWVCIARADCWFWYYQSIFYSAARIQQLWFHLYCKTEINTREGLNFDFLNLLSGFLVSSNGRFRARMKKQQQCICLNTVASQSRYLNNFTHQYLDFAGAFSGTWVKFPCIINKLKFRIIVTLFQFFVLHFMFSRQQSLTLAHVNHFKLLNKIQNCSWHVDISKKTVFLVAWISGAFNFFSDPPLILSRINLRHKIVKLLMGLRFC